MLGRLALLFIVVPILELALLVQLGRWVGLLPTLGLVVVTGVVGAALARAEGLRTYVAFQREMAAGRLPGQSLLDGLSVLVGGAFLLTPGLLTDIAGFSLLLPPSRRWLQRRVKAWVQRRIESGAVRVEVRTPWGGATGVDEGGVGRPGRREPGEGRPLDPSKEIRPDDGR